MKQSVTMKVRWDSQWPVIKERVSLWFGEKTELCGYIQKESKELGPTKSLGKGLHLSGCCTEAIERYTILQIPEYLVRGRSHWLLKHSRLCGQETGDALYPKMPENLIFLLTCENHLYVRDDMYLISFWYTLCFLPNCNLSFIFVNCVLCKTFNSAK